jgi:hypothetical protein
MSNIEAAAMEYDQRKTENVRVALLGALEIKNGRL